MLFSTSGFQKGAIRHVAARGIVTISIVSGRWLYETKGVGLPACVPLAEYAGMRDLDGRGRVSTRCMKGPERFAHALTRSNFSLYLQELRSEP